MSFEGHVENGQIVLDGPAELPEGAKVRVELVSSVSAIQPATPTLYERLKHIVGRAEHLPPDMSVNHDHYLYGTPKQLP